MRYYSQNDNLSLLNNMNKSVIVKIIILGMELDQLQVEDQPHWTHWLLEHSDHVSRRFIVCFRW